jgi:hypothetical protein
MSATWRNHVPTGIERLFTRPTHAETLPHNCPKCRGSVSEPHGDHRRCAKCGTEWA